MQITGKIIQISPVQTGTGKNGEWKKREILLETPGTYPKKVNVQVWGDKIDLSAFPVGSSVTMDIDIESKEFNGRWYTEVKTWRIRPETSANRAYEDEIDLLDDGDDDDDYEDQIDLLDDGDDDYEDKIDLLDDDILPF